MKRLPRDKKDSNSPREFSLVRNPTEVIVRQPRDRSEDRAIGGCEIISEHYWTPRYIGCTKSSEEEEGAFVSRASQLIPHLNSAKCELDGEINAPGSTRARWVSRSRTHRSGALISPSETAFAKIRATGHVRTRPLIERLTAFVSRDPRFRMQRVAVAWNAKEGE